MIQLKRDTRNSSGQQCPKLKYQQATRAAVTALHQSVLLLRRLWDQARRGRRGSRCLSSTKTLARDRKGKKNKTLFKMVLGGVEQWQSWSMHHFTCLRENLHYRFPQLTATGCKIKEANLPQEEKSSQRAVSNAFKSSNAPGVSIVFIL